jgi:hypothetical protein
MSKILKFAKNNKNYLMFAGAALGTFVLYKIVRFFTGAGIQRSMSNIPFSKFMQFPRLAEIVVSHEARTYDDHNYYTSNGLRSYIKGAFGNRYPLLTKDLSKYSVQEVMTFQQHSRDLTGQLYATGLYQIIPSTLAGTLAAAGVKWSDKYDNETQDKLAMALFMGRTALKNYLTGKVADTEANLNAAALDIAKTWASVGVPYDMRGANMWIKKGQSYYHGGGDNAATNPDEVKKVLRLSRLS